MSKGIVAGFVACVTLTLLLYFKGRIGVMPDLNMISTLASMAHQLVHTPDTRTAGHLLHFIIGTLVWGTGFQLLNRRLPGSRQVLKGLLFALGMWLVLMLTVMPLTGAGVFALKLPGMTLISLMLHLIFGAVLGLMYSKLR